MTRIIQNCFCKLWLRSLVLMLGLISMVPAFAQQEKRFLLSGAVVDESGNGIPGASVAVKGSTRGVTTDVDGSFEFEVSESEVLEFSYLGYQTQEIRVGSRTNVTVQLKPQISELETVTIVAYGKQRKESIVGAINTLSGDELNISTGQLSTNLAGKLAGVVVMQRTGEPGASADFWIRGTSTFGSGGNKPLILVDGIEREMDYVDSDDIATFSILKDAAATALYGVRGANGIVLITTKRGSEMPKNKIDVKAEFGMTQPVKLPELANTSQWLDFFDELYRDAPGGAQTPPFNDYERQMYLSGEDPDLYPSVDWMKAMFKNLAMTGRVHANITGGSEKIRHYTSVGWYTEGGIFNVADDRDYNAQLNFNRFNFRSNVDINITRSTTLNLSLSTTYTTRNEPHGSLNDIYAFTMYVTPIATPTIYSNGMLAIPRESSSHNPYNDLNYTGYKRTNRMIAQSLLSLTQDFSDYITEGLSANVKFAWDSDNTNMVGRSMSPTVYYASGRDDQGNLLLNPANEGSNHMNLTRSNLGTMTINFEASANYERLFGRDHRVSAMFLFQLRSKTNTVPSDFYVAFPYRNMGIAGRVTYAFRDKYFTEFNFGYNGSENFAPDKRFGFFPSVAAGYMISNERFWEPIRDKINVLKIRGSYGKIGNDQIGGNRRFVYNTTMNNNANGFHFGTNGPPTPDGVVTGAISTDEYANMNVSWEEATKADVGIELGLFNMVRIQADYFNEKREGIFIQRESTPSVAGEIKPQWVNLGRMENQGFDLSLEFDKQVAKDFNLSLRGNFTYARNRRLYDDKPDQIWKYQNLAGFVDNQQMGLIAVGLFESEEDIANWPMQKFGDVRPGDIKYRDINGDGVVDTFDKIAIGYTTMPEINYGFGASMKWRNVDFSVFFNGVAHVSRIISGQNLFGASSNIIRLGQIYADVAENRWTLDNQNPNAPYPRLSMTKVENNQQPSTYWQRDMSFMRLGNAEIGYTLPSRLSKKIGLSAIRLYVQGKNLATFSKFDLWDPELNANYGNQYPAMRTYTFGVNVKF